MRSGVDGLLNVAALGLVRIDVAGGHVDESLQPVHACCQLSHLLCGLRSAHMPCAKRTTYPEHPHREAVERRSQPSWLYQTMTTVIASTMASQQYASQLILHSTTHFG